MSEQGPQEKPAFDPSAQARMYGRHYDIEQQEGENDAAYRSRVAGVLRSQGNIIEAHEALSGRRWDDPEQGPAGPMAGIAGAVAKAMQGVEYSPGKPEQQVGDDIAAGVLALSGESQQDKARGMLFDMLGPSDAMDVIDSMTRPPRPEDQR